MNGVRSAAIHALRFVGAVAFLLAVGSAAATRAAAQSPLLARAMDLESSNKLREAVAAYRQALDAGEVTPALLGLERVFALLSWNDSIIPVVEGVIRRSPRDPIARSIHLRVLRAMQRNVAANTAFRDWVRASPGDITPYREWARLLLADGDTVVVDSVLQNAAAVFGSTRGLTLEFAQLRSALGQWDHAGIAWREAMTQEPHVESAAAFSLRNAPPDSRRLVRAALLAPPVEPLPRRVLASLELGWGNGREAWTALRELPPGDSTAAIWTAFAAEAERSGAWLPARDAVLAVNRWRPDSQRALYAATLSVEGGDANEALRLAAQAVERLGADGPRVALPVVLQAYALLGRGDDAQRAYSSLEENLQPGQREAYRRLVAWAWVRAGGVTEARAMLKGATPNPDDELTGWLALYAGDLAGARRGLRRVDARVADAATAVAFLSRTKIDSSARAGSAFLTLARRDTSAAATTFITAATEIPEAAPVLLLMAARLHSAQHREPRAIEIWQGLLKSHASAPEAAEAELEWARALRRQGDRAAAIAHLEHLILTWPESALLPQARRELELAKGTVPPSRDAREMHERCTTGHERG